MHRNGVALYSSQAFHHSPTTSSLWGLLLSICFGTKVSFFPASSILQLCHPLDVLLIFHHFLLLQSSISQVLYNSSISCAAFVIFGQIGASGQYRKFLSYFHEKNRFKIRIYVHCKGQLILKCPFGVKTSSKKPTNFFPWFLP